MLEGKKIFITGGAGTLGLGIIDRVIREGWPCDITVYSRDWMKHKYLKRKYPEIRTVVGDVCNLAALNLAMAGHDIVIHAAAMKHIVEGEFYPLSVIETNVTGSQNVLEAAVEQGVKHVVGISTDKACAPINTYGASKMMMERIFHRYAEIYSFVQFHLVRYGNVIGSRGSFLPMWEQSIAEGNYVNVTDERMTRFWLKIDEAVDLILECFEEPSGCTLIPKPKCASMEDIVKAIVPEGIEVKNIGIRPGEKMHECLLTKEEGYRADYLRSGDMTEPTRIRLYPPTSERKKVKVPEVMSSNKAIPYRMKEEEIRKMFGELT